MHSKKKKEKVQSKVQSKIFRIKSAEYIVQITGAEKKKAG